jgi:response regulator RpfG family c-di-GMP phosphodiesterase
MDIDFGLLKPSCSGDSMLKPSIKTLTVKSLLTFIIIAAMVMVVIIALNFRALSHRIVESEALAAAEIIKAGLTAHMKGGIMDKRDYYLNEIRSVTDVHDISVIRSPAVIAQFGKGRHEREMNGDAREVFASGQALFTVDEFSLNPTVRAIIPYVATSDGTLNCLDCHKVKEGTVLGAVDIQLDVTRYRNMASWVLLILLFFSLVFAILIVRNTFHTVQVYVKEPLENLIEKARIAYRQHQPVNPEKFATLEFETVAKEINLFNEEILTNHEKLKHMNRELVALNDEIESTLRETVFTMGVIEEKRSKETKNHTKRVTEYSRLLATRVGLPEAEVELLAAAAPLHDIGKLGISDRILLKPDRLTTEEFEIMKNHTRIGHAMLAHSKRDILKAAAVIAQQHHEKWDGSGYPQGLKGEEIHVFGRVVAVADVFDALLTARPYKKSWSLEQAREWMESERGRHFDPKLVDILFESIEEFMAIGQQYATNGEETDAAKGVSDFHLGDGI